MTRNLARLADIAYVYGVAISTSLAVLVVMLAAITLLPALLSYLRPPANSLRRTDPESRGAVVADMSHTGVATRLS